MERRKISRANVSLPDAVCRLWAPRYADPPALCKARVAELGWDPGSANSGGPSRLMTKPPKPECPTTYCLAQRGLCTTDFDRSFGWITKLETLQLPLRAFAAKHVGLNQHGRTSQGACGFCCLSSPSTIVCLQCSVLPSVHLTLLAGDFVLGFRHCRDWTASAAAGVGSNQQLERESHFAKTVAANRASESNEHGSEQDR
jgi:hypothetical protein